MKDRFNREISYLRISVTDKCNLRCIYCMPPEGVVKRNHNDFLTFETITDVVRVGVELGITKVRLTGGEPLVKRGILDLVAMLEEVEGLDHVAMTTNGVLLGDLAAELQNAGLDSVNISLDTLEADRYHYLTRVGDIMQVVRGIEAARSCGLPVKINMVVMDDTEPWELERMKRFCTEKGLKLQFINHFDLHTKKYDQYTFDRPPRCSECNRIRLLADGTLKPCLHSDEEITLDRDDIKGSLTMAIVTKPENGEVCISRSMLEIGG